MSLCSKAFLKPINLLNLLRQISIVGAMACGMTFVLIGGGFDLSVGSTMGLAGAIAAQLVLAGYNTGIAYLAAVAVGVGIGVTNGILISYLKINPFVTTLGMMTIIRGVVLIDSGGYGFRGLPISFSYLGNKDLFGIPILGIIFGVAIIFAHFFLRYTVFGQYVYAVGGNEKSALFSGVKTNFIKAATYVISGAIAAIGGIMLVSRVNTASPNAGMGYELDVIASCIIGGCRLGGGRGTVFGTMIGVLLLGVMTNGLNLLGVSAYVQQVLKGAIIISAVGVYVYIGGKQEVFER